MSAEEVTLALAKALPLGYDSATSQAVTQDGRKRAEQPSESEIQPQGG